MESADLICIQETLFFVFCTRRHGKAVLTTIEELALPMERCTVFSHLQYSVSPEAPYLVAPIDVPGHALDHCKIKRNCSFYKASSRSRAHIIRSKEADRCETQTNKTPPNQQKSQQPHRRASKVSAKFFH